MKEYDFHKQKPIGKLYSRLFCNELSLAIEIDGDSHCRNEEKDTKKTKGNRKIGCSLSSI